MSEVIVWLAEAPSFPGYYLAETPVRSGKLGDGVELGTFGALGARRFQTRAECEAYIQANPYPAWTPTEHSFG